MDEEWKQKMKEKKENRRSDRRKKKYFHFYILFFFFFILIFIFVFHRKRARLLPGEPDLNEEASDYDEDDEVDKESWTAEINGDLEADEEVLLFL